MSIAFSKRELYYFDLARKQSLKSTHNKVSIGAVIVRGNHVLSKGWNQEKSHPTQFRYNRFRPFKCHHKIHAEIHALERSTSDSFVGASCFTFRHDKKGLLAPSRPCNACYEALSDAGISKIYYSSSSGLNYEEMR